MRVLCLIVITPEYLRQMALYNRWQNEQLYERCASLADGERKRDRGMFFRSIHKTLDHILHVDRALLCTVERGERPSIDLNELLFADFGALRREREHQDAALERALPLHALGGPTRVHGRPLRFARTPGGFALGAPRLALR